MRPRGFNEPFLSASSMTRVDNIENSFWYPVIVAWDRLLYESPPRRGLILSGFVDRFQIRDIYPRDSGPLDDNLFFFFASF